jgi:hypothetical protein
MRYIDIPNPKRVDRNPDKIIELVSNDSIVEMGYVIKNIQLRLYIEKYDKKLGKYSLITSFIETDKGSVEMIYDEGYRGNDALETSSKFLTENLGISSLILRSLIFLDGK